MKTLFTLVLFFCLSFQVEADQLAYLKKEDAEKAVKELQQYSGIWLFCGCCDDKSMEYILPKKIYIKYTNYEDWYEVVVEYIDQNFVYKTITLDLAYVWVRYGSKYKTIGKILRLKHDPCERIENYFQQKK